MQNDTDKLNTIIRLLESKGYEIEAYSNASISTPIIIVDLINELVNNNLITINEKTLKIIEKYDLKKTMIFFKKDYHFNNIPQGYKQINNSLVYNLSFIKDLSNLTFKTDKELDEELNNSLLELERWVEEL